MACRGITKRSCSLAAGALVAGLLTVVPFASQPALAGGSQSKTAPSTAPPPVGYWEFAADGGVFSFGDSAFHGSMGGKILNAPVVGGAETPSSNGYWEVASDGGVFSFGDAQFEGSMGGKHLVAPIVGMAAAPTGNGYWMVASDGGVFAFGSAGFRGSLGGQTLSSPIVGMAATPTGNGYWLVDSEGDVFAFGDATTVGSMEGRPLNAPVVGIAASPTGSGYWLVAATGGIFSFGAATFYGSMGGKHLNAPVVGMRVTPTGGGYNLVAADGGVFSFGDASFQGSMGGKHLNAPVVGMAHVGSSVGGQVLLVGTYDGHPGQFTSIQAAVNAAQPGDWILIAPGDYKADATLTTSVPAAATVHEGWYGGVTITTPDIHLRGMTRNSVIVDGTKPGSAPCSSTPTAQEFGATVPGITGPAGRNGILVWKADNVSIQNLTVCNFLNVKGNGGEEIWWNGGAGSAKIGLAGYSGSYLTATTTFSGTVNGVSGAGNYGIFDSNSAGPGVWNQIYANNFDDSGMYIGACQQACDAWIDHAWMENDALGYSGTNSGGILVTENSQFNTNEDGFDTNTQSVGDPPPPQNGTCPDGGVSAITHSTSCWVFMDNDVHTNNNPNAPGYGAVGQPTGTGMTVAGATHDTVMDNLFEDNGAWGTQFVPYPDEAPGAPGVCTGSGGHLFLTACVYDPEDDALLNNTYVHNGFFGNPTNDDYGQITLFGTEPQNCFAGNVAPDGSTPSDLEQTQPTCGPLTKSSTTGGALGTSSSLINQVLCDTGFGKAFGQDCTAGNYKYPKPASNAPILTSVPKTLPTMPNPCQGVPRNAWCPDNLAS